MSPARRRFVCENCGATQSGWMGRCPECGEWNTMVESVIDSPSRSVTGAMVASPIVLNTQACALNAIPLQAQTRMPVPLEEMSRVLGGGIVPGSVVLISGDPGIGKSTLLLQLAALLGEGPERVLYASGEESLHQIKMRADRLAMRSENLYLLSETNLAQILGQIEQLRPALAIVDSIQSVYSDEQSASPGSVSQVRACAAALQRQAKELGVATFLVGHVTKAGSIAGPRVLEHIVDTVLYLEGDPFQSYRLLRSVKNRFGATSEVGVFEMRGSGLVEVPNPSEAFLAERVVNAPGSAIAVTLEGTRPLLVEVQALCSPTSFGYARRTANGIDYNRLLLIVAVLTRRMGFKLAEQDVFVNVIGGLKIDEPAADLAVAVALASSYLDRPVPADLAIAGEIGLSGELRAVSQLPIRLNEAAKLGFRRILVPRARRKDDLAVKGLEVIPVRSIAEAFRVAVPEKQG